ncbi:hypothetical protein KOR34_52660 [Posidoniimonas corsicana]|uniref:Uncharacterized protein n=1 Tax=Posidoniimonas corsicana TaxID=1938618 RepID=A0A5C5URV3_9BACT|nr:hypothetical protein [Posidoniimonas corsicana]TWT29211.1 hypothetical protein KOR34_52660 [Posidoniimonas corsicana]
MNEHTHETVHEVARPVALAPRISWAAVLAGVVITLSLCWLLHLLGLALGVSIGDAYDSATMEGGLDDAAAIWTIVSWLVAFFIGSLATARLAGSIDDFAGMLHGLTLWGVATLAVIVTTYFGLSMLMSAGQRALSATADAAAATSQTIGAAAVGAGETVQSAMQTDVAQRVKDRLADQAVELAANSSERLTEDEIRSAVEDLDQRTVRRLSQDLMDDDAEGAAELLAGATELSQQDAEALVDGLYEEVEELIGDPENEAPLREDLKNRLANQVAPYAASLDARGGADVSRSEVRTAIQQLDANAARSIFVSLYNGEPEEARQALARNTTLSESEVDELWDGAAEDVEAEVEEYREAARQTAETIGDYTQAVLWVSFAGAATSLGIALLGGWLGAHAGRATYPVTA